MKRFAPALALAVLAVPSPALASDHLMRVTEVQFSTGGDATKQFIELRDPGGEPFPAPPYAMKTFDTNGLPLDTFTIGGLSTLGSNFYLLATAAAALPGTDFTMPAPMSAATRQVCFVRGGGAVIFCVNAGAATPVPASSGNISVPQPPDGQSVQDCTSAYVVAAPTPKAVNNCPAPPVIPPPAAGGGSTGGGSTGVAAEVAVLGPGLPAPDKTPPGQTATASKSAGGGVNLSVKLDEDAEVTASGTVSVPGASKTFRYREARGAGKAGTTLTLKLTLPKAGQKAVKAVKAAQKRRKKLTAKLSVVARDPSGNVATSRLSRKL